jgi:SAM-dependent methyltransferase
MISDRLLTPNAAFSAALQGEPCRVHGLKDIPAVIPTGRWRAEADAGDRELLSRCRGVTVDIGCGPGRMTRGLQQRGVAALGIDVVEEAVRQTRERGGMALQRDVFVRLPGEGRWETALLADGNIGIGGDPARLLRRVSELLIEGGRVVLDLAGPGGPVTFHQIRLEVAGSRSSTFPWAVVPADQIGLVAERASLRVLELLEVEGRWIAALGKTS